jgi:hypothetical protein
MSEIALPMWLVVPLGVLLMIGILALPIVAAFMGSDKDEKRDAQP